MVTGGTGVAFRPPAARAFKSEPGVCSRAEAAIVTESVTAALWITYVRMPDIDRNEKGTKCTRAG